MFNEIIDIVRKLDTLDKCIDSLPKELSKQDLKLDDLYHILEFNKLDSSQCWHLMKEMKQVLQDRRDIKDKMALSKVFKDNKDKLLYKDSRKFLLSEVGKKNKMILSQKYNYNHYNNSSLIDLKILKDGQNEQRDTQ